MAIAIDLCGIGYCRPRSVDNRSQIKGDSSLLVRGGKQEGLRLIFAEGMGTRRGQTGPVRKLISAHSSLQLLQLSRMRKQHSQGRSLRRTSASHGLFDTFPSRVCRRNRKRMIDQDYDLVVIGSGPARQEAAINAAELRKRVVVIERTGMVAGVSIHSGTIPSKTPGCDPLSHRLHSKSVLRARLLSPRPNQQGGELPGACR
jgi:hypothetical protein